MLRPLNANIFVLWPGPKAILKVSRNAFAISAVVCLSSSNVWRFRLFTPRTLAPASKATFNSLTVTTSTKGSRPHSRLKVMSARSLLCGRMDTMSNTVSAPCATASNTWYSSMTKSFRKHAGLRTPCSLAQAWVFSRTSFKSWSVPLNHLGSVKTDKTEAPSLVYSKACCAASKSAFMSPFDGEARLNSAASASLQLEVSAAERHSVSDIGAPMSAMSCSASRLTSASGFATLASLTSSLRCAAISCNRVVLDAGSP
mmetsp:Transcript_23177/g.59098  ORF Transcript_23177/g.59098 Transcript_23177/m.59098 type:complete len:257 (-) Transcript_23177:93-863(-)